MRALVIRKIHRLELKNTVFLTIIIIVLLEPAFLSTIYVVDKLFEVLKIIVTIYIVVTYIDKCNKTPFYILLPILYEGIVLFSTIINSAIYKSAILEMIYVMDFCLLTHLMVDKNVKLYVQVIYKVLEVYAYINLLSCFMNPNGLYINSNGFPCFFLGYRNTAYQYLLPMIVVSTIYSLMQYGRIKYRVYVDIFCCMIFAMMTNTVTGTILFLVYFLGLFIYNFISHIKVKWIFIAGIIFSYLLVVVRIQNIFSKFFEQKLKRNITLSGRTILWDVLLKFVNEHPLFGWGIVDMPLLTNIYWAGQSHNQFLQIIYQCGVFGLSVFLITLLVFSIKFDKCKQNRFKGTFILSMFVYMLSFQTEGYVLPIFYAILILMAEADKLDMVLYNE